MIEIEIVALPKDVLVMKYKHELLWRVVSSRHGLDKRDLNFDDAIAQAEKWVENLEQVDAAEQKRKGK